MKREKACGVDGIPSEFLTEGRGEVLEGVIFNKVITDEKIPKARKKGR